MKNINFADIKYTEEYEFPRFIYITNSSPDGRGKL